MIDEQEEFIWPVNYESNNWSTDFDDAFSDMDLSNLEEDVLDDKEGTNADCGNSTKVLGYTTCDFDYAVNQKFVQKPTVFRDTSLPIWNKRMVAGSKLA